MTVPVQPWAFDMRQTIAVGKITLVMPYRHVIWIMFLGTTNLP